MKYTYLIISPVACGLYTVPRLCADKDTERVYFFLRDFKHMGNVGKGLQNIKGWEKYEFVTDPFKVIRETPKDQLIIIFDDNGLGYLADHLRADGYTVVSGGSFADTLENDRWGTVKFMQKFMNVPETEYFDSFDAGIAYLKGLDKSERFVFKPQDPEVPKDKTYVGKDIQDLIGAMSGYKNDWKWKDGFILQRFIEGIEADFSAYFDGKTFLPNSFSWYFENKPFLAGDLGPATGGEIAAVLFRPLEGEIAQILLKMQPVLQKMKYNGQLAINSIFSKEDHKPYFLELSPRFGYPSLEMEITLLEDNNKSYVSLIKQLAFGAKQALFPTNKISVMANISMPPYPSDEGAQSLITGMPVSWDSKWDTYIFPHYLMYDQKKKGFALAGYSGLAVSVTCADSTLDGAVAMLVDTYIPTIRLQDKQYRNDVGKSAKERSKTLKEWGIIQ